MEQMEQGMWLLHFTIAPLAIMHRNSYSSCIITFEQRVWSLILLKNVSLNATLLLYCILSSSFGASDNTFITVLYHVWQWRKTVPSSACLPASVLSPQDWNITSGFVVVYSVETGTSTSVAHLPLVQVSHRAEWQDPWNNSDRLDPHCQHTGLSVSWFHQGHHSMVVDLLPMTDHYKTVSFNRNASCAVDAISSCKAMIVLTFFITNKPYVFKHVLPVKVSAVLHGCGGSSVYFYACHSFMTNALQIGRKANWHELQWCKQHHTTNSCVWSTNACTAILELQSKRNTLYTHVCATPAIQLEDRQCTQQNTFPFIEKGWAIIYVAFYQN